MSQKLPASDSDRVSPRRRFHRPAAEFLGARRQVPVLTGLPSVEQPIEPTHIDPKQPTSVEAAVPEANSERDVDGAASGAQIRPVTVASEAELAIEKVAIGVREVARPVDRAEQNYRPDEWQPRENGHRSGEGDDPSGGGKQQNVWQEWAYPVAGTLVALLLLYMAFVGFDGPRAPKIEQVQQPAIDFGSYPSPPSLSSNTPPTIDDPFQSAEMPAVSQVAEAFVPPTVAPIDIGPADVAPAQPVFDQRHVVTQEPTEVPQVADMFIPPADALVDAAPVDAAPVDMLLTPAQPSFDREQMVAQEVPDAPQVADISAPTAVAAVDPVAAQPSFVPEQAVEAPIAKAPIVLTQSPVRTLAIHPDAIHSDAIHPDAIHSDAIHSDAIHSDAIHPDAAEHDVALLGDAHWSETKPDVAAQPGLPQRPLNSSNSPSATATLAAGTSAAAGPKLEIPLVVAGPSEGLQADLTGAGPIEAEYPTTEFSAELPAARQAVVDNAMDVAAAPSLNSPAKPEATPTPLGPAPADRFAELAPEANETPTNAQAQPTTTTLPVIGTLPVIDFQQTGHVIINPHVKPIVKQPVGAGPTYETARALPGLALRAKPDVGDSTGISPVPLNGKSIYGALPTSNAPPQPSIDQVRLNGNIEPFPQTTFPQTKR